MIVITIARKPLSKGSVVANVLAHGTGGLNIDGCRIGTGDNIGRDLYESKGWKNTSGMTGSVSDDWKKGRWPANLILEHLPGCRCVGSTTIKGNRVDTRPEGDGGRADKSQWRYRPTEATRRGYSDEQGQETVAAWECAFGCPVAGLDLQSGFSVSPQTTGRGAGGQNGRYGLLKAQGKVPAPGDAGGASRFFKQVGGQKK